MDNGRFDYGFGLPYAENMNSISFSNSDQQRPMEPVNSVTDIYIGHAREENRDEDATVPHIGGEKVGPWRTLFVALGYQDWSGPERDRFNHLLDDAMCGIDLSRKWKRIPALKKTEYINRLFQNLSSR